MLEQSALIHPTDTTEITQKPTTRRHHVGELNLRTYRNKDGNTVRKDNKMSSIFSQKVRYFCTVRIFCLCGHGALVRSLNICI